MVKTIRTGPNSKMNYKPVPIKDFMQARQDAAKPASGRVGAGKSPSK